MNTWSAEKMARYSRQVILPDIGMEGQQRLANARVLIIGMGGLGSPAALYLAAAGIGRLGLADFDTVALHNLQRQVLHDTTRVGQSKLDSACDRLKTLNPEIKLERYDEGITVDNAIDIFSKYDLIVDGSDNFPTRYLVNDAAFLTGKPLIYGSIFQFEGQASLFNPTGKGPCYRCLFPNMPKPGSVPNCEEAGVIGALCGIIGNIQAMEAIKWIVGLGDSLCNQLLVIDVLTMNFRKLNLKKDPDCPLCGSHPAIKTLTSENYQFSCHAGMNDDTGIVEQDTSNAAPPAIDVKKAKTWLIAEDKPFLLDVREVHEVAICKIEGSHHIPMNDVINHLSDLPKEQAILVYCHHGMRSLKVVELLRKNSFAKATNMTGGIEAWAINCVPDMQRY